jgi:hypothetical protein
MLSQRGGEALDWEGEVILANLRSASGVQVSLPRSYCTVSVEMHP